MNLLRTPIHSVLILAVPLLAFGNGVRTHDQRPESPSPVPSVTTIETVAALPSDGRLGGVSVDRDGNIYVSNFGASVWRIDPDGAVTTLANDLNGSSGNAIDAAGNLLQASFVDGRIVRIGRDGVETAIVTAGLDGPVGLTVGDDGSVYVCNCRGNTVSRVSPEGSVSEFARSPDFDCPNGITRGPDGALYVVSYNNGYVVRVDAKGHTVRMADIPDGRNAHITSARGALWVTKIEANRMYRLAMDGSAERYAGTGSVGLADGAIGEAPLAHPNGIAVMPGEGALVVNTLHGEWRGDTQTRIVLRRVDLPVAQSMPERIRITVGDMVFDALAAGPADGELVLLLHGFPETSEAYESQLSALAAAGYRAVAPDQRGYSPGARPTGIADYAMGNLVADVLGMVDALGRDQFHLVGHDWGGAVAWVVATRVPARVRTLTVLSTPHYAAFAAQLADTASDQSRRSSYFVDFSAPGAERTFLADDKAVLREMLASVPANHRQTYLDRLGTPEALGAALNWYRASGLRPGATGSGTATPATAPRVSPITVPTLYVWGALDGAFGRAAVVKSAAFVTGPFEFHTLEDVGHWLPELAADRVNRLLLNHLKQGAQPGGISLNNYREARRVLDRAAAALGGRAAVAGVQNLRGEYIAHGIARGQSLRPDPVWDSTHASGTFLYDASGRLFHEEQFVNEGGTDRSFRRVLADERSWNYWVSREQLLVMEPSDVALMRSRPETDIRLALPHAIIKAALDNPSTLRSLGTTGPDPDRLDWIAFTDTNGQSVSLGMSARSGLPVVVERLGSDPFEGDAAFAVHFRDFATVNDLNVPRRLDFSINRLLFRSWTLSGLQLNQPVDEAAFAPPPDVQPAPQPPRFAPQGVAPGVHVIRLYSGPANSYSTVLVEFSDHVVVLEAPLTGAFYPVIRQIASSVASGKPIRSLIVTHHHSDHAGGAARFLAEGVDVIAPADAIKAIQSMRQAKHTIAPQPPGVAKVGRLIALGDSLVLSDESRTLRIIQVGPTPHADQIAVVHLPNERVLFVADLFAVPESHKFSPPSETTRHFARLMDRFGLDFDIVIPVHGVVGTKQDLADALAAGRGDN